MEFHEVANIFPLMDGDEYKALVEDIRHNSQREPIWTYQGKIIDGRNRFRACKEVGIEPHFKQWDGNGHLLVSWLV
jgi:ParB-like chromosome segregation protein Spo0J